ncbi:MAG: hypothetical protein FI729_04570 [SAR202 cluster bacterium]|nr:hypothetical protein [SAR202 cluster bacterium]|tara:strand:- start:1395 stop:2420 length:1026 start_codon:yes stop_codon:yes gene_type:complete
MWNFVGNEHVVSLLSKSVINGHISHSYLFSGPANVGKETLAIKFAQFLQCKDFSTEGPCGACLSCWKISKENHPDVQFIEVNPAKNISGNKFSVGIEDIIDIQRTFILKPLEGMYRIFIFREASFLTEDAFGALLKWIEEPPPNVVFILITDNYSEILPTITSRCQTIAFTHVSQEKIESALAQSSYGDKQQRLELSKLSKGSIGWAIKASKNPEIIDDYKHKIHIASTLFENDLESRLKYAEDIDRTLRNDKEEAIKHLGVLMSWWRDLMVIKNGLPGNALNTFALDVLLRHSAMMSNFQILTFIHKIGETIELLKNNVNSRLVLDSLMLSVPDKLENNK